MGRRPPGRRPTMSGPGGTVRLELTGPPRAQTRHSRAVGSPDPIARRRRRSIRSRRRCPRWRGLGEAHGRESTACIGVNRLSVARRLSGAVAPPQRHRSAIATAVTSPPAAWSSTAPLSERPHIVTVVGGVGTARVLVGALVGARCCTRPAHRQHRRGPTSGTPPSSSPLRWLCTTSGGAGLPQGTASSCSAAARSAR